MGNLRKRPENVSTMVACLGKKYVRYEEGAELFSMGVHSFEQLAKDAGAVYRVRRVVLVNVQVIEAYLEKKCKSIE